jgi:phosphoribosylanthranilate isomerase
MARVRVKICGVMRPEDAAAACRCGADAIGLIFHPASPRNVPVERAREVIAALEPFVTPVGVFVDAPPQQILDTAATLGLRTVQLNGHQSADDIAELRGVNVLRAVRVTRGGLATQLDALRRDIATHDLSHLIGLVMEPGGTKQPGGTGIANDWDEVLEARRSNAFNLLPPLVAAGGLTPETVADVVRRTKPFAVDVSSGVESSLGMKSEEKIRQFIDAVTTATADVT